MYILTQVSATLQSLFGRGNTVFYAILNPAYMYVSKVKEQFHFCCTNKIGHKDNDSAEN